jgi:2,3-bisphosphoglycerate-independent phosphoglycerate mutase
LTTKYAIIVPDGAADEPLEEFDKRTVLQAAEIPNMDKISTDGRQGLVRTIPEGLEPGSDIAQMSLLGYNPQTFYTGRAPIEAIARNIELSIEDWVFRCNLVTIVDGKMVDHSAGHISTEEASTLIKELDEQIGNNQIRFYPGVSYRHLLVFKGLEFDIQTYPPHDNIGKAIDKILPRGKGAELLIDLMARSQQLFVNHDINKVRSDLGENQVSSIWLWGQGKKARMESFEKRFGIKGATITAVDLVKGLSMLIGFDFIDVPGATGFVDTNYEGKGAAAIEALDKYIVGPVLGALEKYESWRILVAPDHPTPLRSCAHSPEPVPFAMAGTDVSGILHTTFSEVNAAKSGFKIDNGFELMEYFLKS